MRRLGRCTQVRYAQTRRAAMDMAAHASVAELFFYVSDLAQYGLIWADTPIWSETRQSRPQIGPIQSKTGRNKPRIGPIWAETIVKINK